MMQSERVVIDLFSGAGGFTLGAYTAGFIPMLAVDIDSDLTASFGTNFPKTKLLLSDLSQAEPNWILRQAGLKRGKITGILGGPPCQGFSFIGKRDPSDNRSKLVGSFFDFVAAVEPVFFVMENVPGLLTPPFNNFIEIGLSKIRGDYEIVGPTLVDAADYATATMRKRAFVIGYRKEHMDPISEKDLTSSRETVTVYQAIHDLPSPPKTIENSKGLWGQYARRPVQGIIGRYARQARRIPPQGLSTAEVRSTLKKGFISGFIPTNHTSEVVARWKNLPQGRSDQISRCHRLKLDSPCPTIRAGTGKDKGGFQSIRPIHPVEDRVITVREAARLQGFPDWFQFHSTKWHSFRMIGNSVSPHVSHSILGIIADKLE